MRFWCESNLKHFLHGWFRIDADCALAALENRVDWLIIKILYFECLLSLDGTVIDIVPGETRRLTHLRNVANPAFRPPCLHPHHSWRMIMNRDQIQNYG